LRDWVSRKLAKTSNRKYRVSEKQKPDAIVAAAKKRLVSRFYQLKTGHCLTGQYLEWTARRPDTKCWWCQYIQTREHLSRTAPSGGASRKPSRQPLKETRELPDPTRGRDRTKIAELLADERCSQAVLVFLATRRREDVRPIGSRRRIRRGREASEWEYREREEQLAFLREEEERLGLGFSRSFVVFSALSSVFHIPYIFWRSASGRLHLDGPGATHPQKR